MMINPRVWWHGKTQHKKNNWLLLGLLLAFLAGCTVEALTFWSLLGVVPGVALVWLEVS
jgi:hypothetical protein